MTQNEKPNRSGDWPEYRRLVLSDISRLEQGQLSMDKKMDKCLHEIALLKLRASIWGAAAGMVFGPVAAAIIWQIFNT